MAGEATRSKPAGAGWSTRARDDLAVTGRLTLERDSWVYRPSHATVHTLDTTAELRWARTCPVQGENTFGLFSPGVLTFHVDGVGAVGVEARHVAGIEAMSGHLGPR
ncbi:hypothetical protein [uncultured Jatrophihabitans sp.]|uniref:hypothetical protein n=1 Tax=uncultured Jatrophihabitans sp. TaxID=1610747 RepID=UPI0035CC0A86